jgi:hypothetical protein
MDNNDNKLEGRSKALIPLTGTALALLVLAIIAIVGAGTVMMMMG